MASGAPFPAQQQPIIQETGLFDVPLLRWFNDLRTSVDAAAATVPDGKVQLTNQTASIGTTAFPTASLAAGLYALQWYLQVTTPAGVSSSAQVTVSWTSNANTPTKVGATNNGNTATTYESNGVALIHIDAASPVSYAIAYASNPAGAMVYEFNAVLMLVSADA